MINNNSIDSIQRQYAFAVQPVNFFESSKPSDYPQKSSFEFINQMSLKNFNPFHPNVKSETMAKHLDILS